MAARYEVVEVAPGDVRWVVRDSYTSEVRQLGMNGTRLQEIGFRGRHEMVQWCLREIGWNRR